MNEVIGASMSVIPIERNQESKKKTFEKLPKLYKRAAVRKYAKAFASSAPVLFTKHVSSLFNQNNYEQYYSMV